MRSRSEILTLESFFFQRKKRVMMAFDHRIPSTVTRNPTSVRGSIDKTFKLSISYSMNIMTADELAQQIIVNKRAYYAGKPIVSDAEYDALEDKLRVINPNHWALRRVGSEGGTIAHSSPMLSANKAKTIDEITRWAGNKRLVWGYKIDGMNVELIYVDGTLERAVSRGDGLTGDDITEQSKLMVGVPSNISRLGMVNIRGEAYIPLSRFNPDGEHKSPRNLAVGTLRSKTPSDVAERGVHFMAWDIMDDTLTGMKKIITLKELGFKTADQGPLEISYLETLYKSITDDRTKFDFEMDGLVMKYDDVTDRQSAGETSHHPKWLIALKFPSTETTTVIEKIDWQVGRTGKVTPVATVTPIELAGATITRATLHNAKFVFDHAVAIGATVSIIRSGDVIPKILDVVERSNNNVIIPANCPICDAKLDYDGTTLFCRNKDCGDIALRKIEHFVKTVGIDQIGPSAIQKLWDGGKVRYPFHLYTLESTYLERELGANGLKMYKNIQNAKTIPMDVFLASLGIRSLGHSVSRDLVDGIDDVDDITNEHIRSIVGPTIAESVITGLGDRSLFEPYRAVGIKIVPYKRPSSGTSGTTSTRNEAVAGKRIYITGSVKGYKKDDLEGIVTGAGGVWSSSVSKNMDILVIGDNAGPAKVQKATELHIMMMSAEAFMKLIGK